MAESSITVNEMFTPTSIVSVGLASSAVTLASNALYMLFGVPQRYTAAASSLVLAYGFVAIKASPIWFEWVLAFFNACLLFCTAMGINDVGHHVAPDRRDFMATGGPAGRSFWKPWL